MNFDFRKCNIFYRWIDRKTDVVNIFLHGWGMDYKSLFFCKDLTKKSCLFLDFPPFGKSGGDLEEWNIFTYVNMVIALCSRLGIDKFNLVGHSFGGRIAIILATICKNQTDSLILIDSAGLRPKRSLSYYSQILCYKIRKKMHMDTSRFGSKDFKSLPQSAKGAFCSIINTHLDDFLPQIKCRTLIIYGEKDKTTPLYMAKKLHKKIKNSNLVIIKNAGHFPFLERKLDFSKEIKPFIN